MKVGAAGTRFHREPKPESFSNLSKFSKVLSEILKEPLPLSEGKQNELSPRRLPLSPGARELWFTFADEIEGQIGPRGALWPVRGFANKLPEHAARLAAVLTLVMDLQAPEISESIMQDGIILAKYYLNERLRIQADSTIDRNLLVADQLLKWLHDDWRERNRLVSLPDIYQRGPSAIRDKDKALEIVGILVDHGWLVEYVDTTGKGLHVVNGTSRKQVYKIVEAPTT